MSVQYPLLDWRFIVKRWQRWVLQSRDRIFDGAVLLLCGLSLLLSVVDASLTQDVYHWGFIYPAAAGMKAGLLPHRDIPVFYGVVTSAFQALGLGIFGENLRALGITTGIFYSFSLWLSYQVFRRLLDRAFASLGVLLIFLLHSYMILPWANYFSYPFVLIAVLYLLCDRQSVKDYTLAGGAIALSMLARYSSVQASLPAFLCYFCYLALARSPVPQLKRKFVAFITGLSLPIGLFFVYLIGTGSFDDFLLHNQLMVKIAGVEGLGVRRHLINILQAQTIGARDFRSWLLSLVIVVNGLALGWAFLRHRSRQFALPQKWVLIASVTVFGTLNAFNHYEVFRLVNGASIGVGLLLYLIQRYLWSIEPARMIGLMLLAIFCFTSAETAVFTQTAADPWPSNPNLLRDGGVMQQEIPILRGRMLSPNRNAEYQKILGILSQLDDSYVMVNYTHNMILPMLTQRSSPQILSQYFPGKGVESPAEKSAIDAAIVGQRAIIFSAKPLIVAGYVSVAAVTWTDFSESFQMYVPEKTQISP
jgi:hypothetical protein